MKRDYFEEISSSKAVKNRRAKKRFMKDKEAVVGFFQKAKKTVQDYRDGAEERDKAATERFKRKTELLKAKAAYNKAKGSSGGGFFGGSGQSMFSGGGSLQEPPKKSWSIGNDTGGSFGGSWSVGMPQEAPKMKKKRAKKPKYKKVVYYR